MKTSLPPRIVLNFFFVLGASCQSPAKAKFTPIDLRVCDVKSYGARADGQTKDTFAIQAAIDDCATTGGTVDFHDGTFLSGMITLRSNIELRIEPSAILKGTQDDSDYPTLTPQTLDGQPLVNRNLSNCRKSFIYAVNANNINIDGGGIIDGNGINPNWNGPEATRPMAIFIVLSSNVTLENITIQNAGMWDIVNLETDYLTIRKLKVHSYYGKNRDGLDIADCHHVLIEDSEIFSQDDAICLKSGSAKGVYDVTVRNTHVLQSGVANGLKLGTASTGSFKKILFENIIVENVDKAAMAVESVDGAEIDDVRFNNIEFHKAGTAAFVILGRRGHPPAIGSIKNIYFSNITGDTKHTWGSAISGTVIDGRTYAPENIHFDNVHVTNFAGASVVPSEPPEYAGQYPDPNLWGNLPAFGFYFRHINGLSVRNALVTSPAADVRSSTFATDVVNIP